MGTWARDRSQSVRMSSAVAKVAKPMLRGLHVESIKKNIIIATVLSTVTTGAWYFAINKPRIQAYKDFYANYDAEKDFQRMKALGVFQSTAMIAEKAEEEGGDEDEE